MFGYIIVNKAEMKFKEFDVYHSYYCGLCQVLKKRYGARGQITLSFDMTFLVMLLSGLYEPETRQDLCRCIAHPLEKHPYQINLMTEYVADMNVLLAYYKCQDDWTDEKKLHKLILGKLLEGKVTENTKLYRNKVERVAELMRKIASLEKEDCEEIDTMAGLFGRVMGEIVACREDEWTENLRSLGCRLGEFIYLLDAYEDVEEDIKKNRYNPLAKRFGQSEFEEDCRMILTMKMSDCCREFEKLPILKDVEILRNILYSGVWCRYETVSRRRAERKTAVD